MFSWWLRFNDISWRHASVHAIFRIAAHRKWSTLAANSTSSYSPTYDLRSSCLRINERSLYLFLLDRRNDRQFSWAKHNSLSMVLRMAESSMFWYKSLLTFPAIFASNAQILIKKMTKVTVRVVFKKWGILALRLSTILCFSTEKSSEMIKVSGSKRICLPIALVY